MALAPGTRVGAYEILAPLGAGGMGEVYRARDARLGRAVALKTLPPEFASDADRRARFEREAKTLATLNHPHIAQIYGLEELPAGAGQAGPLALAMELVEGEDLATRLTRGPLPLDEVWPLARQIAAGLEAAHEAGIVHRDLKPANIRVTADGVAKVLDFGLAKPLNAAAGAGSGDAGAGAAGATHSPTIMTSPAMTLQGVILGTAPYMAPEQAKGRVVDRRADIWAFGCVLYELLTGRRAFDGDDVPDILGAILKTEPDWTRLPPATPPRVRTLLQRCLAKDKTQRLQHIGDARLELADDTTSQVISAPAPRRASRLPWTIGGAVVGAAAAAGLLALQTPAAIPPGADTGILRYTIPVPTTRFLGPANFALSPDGRSLAFAAPGLGADPAEYGGLHVQPLDALEPRVIAAYGTTIRAIAWSPDGRFLLTNGGGLRVTDIATGGAQTVDNTTGGLLTYGVAWGADRLFLRAEGPLGLAAFRGAQAQPERVDVPQKPPAEELRLFPTFLADGRRYAFVARRPAAPLGEICIGRVDAVDARCLGLRTTSSVQVVAGALLYLNQRELLAHPFDEAGATVTGDPVRLASDVALGYLGLGAFSASHTGRLAYRTGESGIEELVWFDRTGRQIAAAPATAPRVILNFDLSRDGRTLVLTDGEKLWFTDLQRAVTSQDSIAQGGGISPVLSSDGRRVAVATNDATRIVTYDIDGSSKPVHIERPASGVIEDWSPDGRWIALTSGWLVSTSGEPAVRFATVPSGATLDEIEFSPDGRWLTYNLGGGSLGTTQSFVARANGSGERWQISTNGGAQGRWSPDGREVFYLAANGDLMAVAISTAGQRPSFSPPQRLFATGLRVSAIQDQYAVAPDGRILISRPVVPPEQERVTVVVNWPTLLTSAAASP